MITLKEWMEVANYRITEGGDYFAYGGAYALTSWNGDQDGYSIEIIFSPRTQEVYEVQACDYKHNRAYRLVHGDYRDEKLNDEAWDDTKWIDLESDDDWIQKALAIVAGEDYDTRVTIPLDFPEAELMVLFKQAHAADMTFNNFVEKVLREKLADEGFIERLKEQYDVAR
jgi:hypothetical protein